MTTTTPERRLFAGIELRDVETTESYSMMKGRAVPYGDFTSIGWFMEAFAPRSLGKSIKEAARDLPLNLFHDNRWWPIGAANKWTESEDGLDGEWRLDNSESAQNAARLADNGMLTGLSIEFIPVRSEWEYVEEWDPARGPEFMDKVTRIEARLLAVGLVQAPAYVNAGVELVRSADARQVQSASGAPLTPHLNALKARTEALRTG